MCLSRTTSVLPVQGTIVATSGHRHDDVFRGSAEKLRNGRGITRRNLFDQAQTLVGSAEDEALRNLLRDILATRDQITADLAKGDAAALLEI